MFIKMTMSFDSHLQNKQEYNQLSYTISNSIAIMYTVHLMSALTGAKAFDMPEVEQYGKKIAQNISMHLGYEPLAVMHS